MAVCSKMLLVFCDGTAMDGLISSPQTGRLMVSPRGGGSSASQSATNVLRLSRAVKPLSANGDRAQIVFYQSGVASESNFKGEPTALGMSLMQKISGRWVASKIREAYAFIAQNYAEGDEICLFGFSRGAYTARKVAGLIEKIGLLETKELGNFFTIWRQLVDGQTPKVDSRKVRIKFVGVWDTVGSVIGTIDALQIKDNRFPTIIDRGRHALSLHENREGFLPTLWAPDTSRSDDVLVECWFPGSHSDVGGGNPRHELADISLFWMVGEVEKFVNLDKVMIEKSKQPGRDDWGRSQPENSWNDWKYRFLGAKTRLQSGHITKESHFHESIKYIPAVLREKENMVTLNLIQRAEIQPLQRILALNDFEKGCQDRWREDPRSGRVPVYETMSQLFDGPVNWVSATGYGPDVPPQAIEGGSKNPGIPIYVAHAIHGEGSSKGLYPGNWSWNPYLQTSGASIIFNEELVRVAEKDLGDVSILVGSPEDIRWLPFSGTLDLKKLYSTTPVKGGKEPDGTDLYIVRASDETGTFFGSVKSGDFPYVFDGNGRKFVNPECEVLVFADSKHWDSNMIIGSSEIIKDGWKWETTEVKQSYSKEIVLPAAQAKVPHIAVAISKLDMGKEHADLKASVSKIEKNKFTLLVSRLGKTGLFDARVEYLITAPDDPNFQCGTITGDETRPFETRINFARPFVVKPQVWVGINGFSISDGHWRLRVYATEIDTKGFTIHLNAWGDTVVKLATADWVAFPEDKPGVWSGTFSSIGTTKFDGQDSFGYTFSEPPKVLMGLNEFDINTKGSFHPRIEVKPKNDKGTDPITTTTVDWHIGAWGDAQVWSGGGSYLALENIQRIKNDKA